MTNLSRICVVAFALSFITSLCAQAQSNLLQNPGFEEQGDWELSASHWDLDNPDTHGDTWGTAYRENWRAHSGSREGSVRGLWSGGGGFGGWWQEVPALPGATYTLSGWFWADSSWAVQTNQGLKLEFYTGTETNVGPIISDVTYAFDGIGESWTQKQMSAVAPTNAAWVRVVVYAYNVGWDGALQFDDISLIEEPGSVIEISQRIGLLPKWICRITGLWSRPSPAGLLRNTAGDRRLQTTGNEPLQCGQRTVMTMLTGMMVLGPLTAFRRRNRDDIGNS